jgi:hypothetical protein
MRPILALLLCTALLLGCGPYRIRYLQPSKSSDGESSHEVVKGHAHGIGPLIIGGGGFFFLFQSMSPALVDYTGEVDLRTICPEGYDDFSEVQHSFGFGHSALAALISWLAIVNWYHRSYVIYTCEQRPAAIPG